MPKAGARKLNGSTPDQLRKVLLAGWSGPARNAIGKQGKSFSHQLHTNSTMLAKSERENERAIQGMPSEHDREGARPTPGEGGSGITRAEQTRFLILDAGFLAAAQSCRRTSISCKT